LSRGFVAEDELGGLALWMRLAAKRAPLSFDLELTARCNNDCRHCYINLSAGDRAAGGEELSLDEIGRIADEAVQLGVLWVLLTGGEPLLRRDFGDVYLALKRRGLLTSVFTNATLVDRDIVGLLRAYPPRTVEVTMYGATQETYEAVSRARGSYRAFRRGLDLLLQAGLPVRLKAMALRSNVHELQAMAAFARAYGCGPFRFDPLLHLRFDGDAERNAEIRRERLTPAEIVAAEQSDRERAAAVRDECRRAAASGDLVDAGLLLRCGAGDGSFTVGYDGTFRLCSSLWHPECISDLRRVSLAEAWSTLVPAVRALRSENAAYRKACGSCQLTNLCLWCPAHAYLESGALDAPVEYFCETAHARAEAAGRNPMRFPRLDDSTNM
jgi:radical SAM protein with 4Fe4S-binding SPASM domain